jgi:hypothetical protein
VTRDPRCALPGRHGDLPVMPHWEILAAAALTHDRLEVGRLLRSGSGSMTRSVLPRNMHWLAIADLCAI